MDIDALERIGFNSSEAKVYLALLELGSTSKGPLVKKSSIASSKIYEVMDKLIEKGLASEIKKNNVKYFKAAPPKRIKDYLNEKKKQIEKEEKSFENFLPYLEGKHLFLKEEIDAEIFKGRNGLETAFDDMINSLKQGEIEYVFGASKGSDSLRTRRFYDKYQTLTHKKGIKIKAIFNEDARSYFKKSKAIKKHIEARFLKQSTPTEVNIYGEKVLIIVWSNTPIVIMIKGKEVSYSFQQYFNTMWETAKK